MKTEPALRDYRVIVRQREDKFLLSLPELSLFVEDGDLEEAYKKLANAKSKVLADFAEVGEAPPVPVKSQIAAFTWKYLAIATLIAMLSSAIIIKLTWQKITVPYEEKVAMIDAIMTETLAAAIRLTKLTPPQPLPASENAKPASEPGK